MFKALPAFKTLPAALALLASPALAQEPEDAQAMGSVSGTPGRWTFTAGAATDNRSKDASKSEGDPFVYGGAEWESPSGLFYAGSGAETIRSSGSALEVQLGAGVRPQIAGFDVDLNATHKWRLDADPGQDAEAWEFTGNLSRSIGPASARLQVQYSPDSTGSTEAFTWVEGRLGWDVTDRLQGTVALGRREQDKAPDYTGWNAGVTYAVNRRLDIDLRWFDTNLNLPGDQYAGALVAGVNVVF